MSSAQPAFGGMFRQLIELGVVGYKVQEPPRERLFRGGSSQTGRSRWRGRHGDQLTLVAACRDSLRVIGGQLGINLPARKELVASFTSGYSLLDPTRSERGNYNSKYRLRINVDREKPG